MLAFFVWNLTLSGTYKAEASIEIDASSTRIHEHLDNLNTWTNWSTFLRRDTSITLQFSTPSQGERAWISWKNSNQTGGRLEILKDDSLSLDYLITLDGIKGAKMNITIVPSEERSTVKWTAEGELPFYARFMKNQFEKTVSQDFEKSLSQLSTLLVNGSLPSTDELNREDVLSETNEMENEIEEATDSLANAEMMSSIMEGQWESGTFYYKQVESTIHQLSWEKMVRSYEEVRDYLGESGFKQSMFIKYDVYDEKHDYVMLYVGIIADVDLPRNSRDIHTELIHHRNYIERKQSDMESILHYGDNEMDEYLNAHGYQMHGRVFERFILDDSMKPKASFVRYPIISASDAITSL